MSGVNQLKLFDTYVREGDRVMVVKNDYDKNIFNGDVGKISSIDLKKQQVTIKVHSYDNAPASLVVIPVSEVGEYLRLAYAVTVHKSQGQEYDYIFMPITDSFSIQLVRNLLYTSVTRAKKKVILYGTRTAFEKAINNNTEDTRNTLLMERIVSNVIPF
jgi:exodeoxyribonuclease V alpha subunit